MSKITRWHRLKGPCRFINLVSLQGLFNGEENMKEIEDTREYRPGRRLPAPRFHPSQRIPLYLPEGTKLGKFNGIPMIVPTGREELAMLRQQVLLHELNVELTQAKRICEVTEARKVL